uniref:Ferredoxin-type protein NapF n=1 Tax=Magnetococcus massalia (strain MO-1) TaxID=451514 RepID=A0A1S7LHJ8_MAGMO|nr:Ferredoxin-type protein NapF [Candidatus Magnetococcus massalia]
MPHDTVLNGGERETKPADGQTSSAVQNSHQSTSTVISRRHLLRGRIKPPADALLPPWSHPPTLFYSRCSRCDACITACPERLIVRGDGGFPQIDFRQGECDFCRKCLEICEDHALSGEVNPPLPLRPVIADNCLPKRGVACQSCRDGCEPMALRFPPQLSSGGRGIALPQLESDLCSGCGGCVAPCPVGAITMVPKANLTPEGA